MKRLLAYLFIILGLGLTFSVKANANNSYVEGICIGNGDMYQEKYQLRLNTKKYPCKLSIVIRKSTNPKQYNNLKGLIPKKIWSCMVKANNKNGTWCKKDGYVNTNRSIILSSTKGTDFYNKLTQIAKAEPSQQEMICLDSQRGWIFFYQRYKTGSWNSSANVAFRCTTTIFPQDTRYNEFFLILTSDAIINKEFPVYHITKKKEVTEEELNKFVKKEPSQSQPDSNLEEKKKKIAEEKRKIEEEKRKIAEAKKKQEEEDKKRIAEAKKKEEEEQKYRILVKKFGDDCKDNSLGSPEFNKCLKDVEAEDLLQAKLQREFLASLTPEEARAYTCNNTFGFRKGSSNFKDCIFKLYTTELELEKLDLEKQLALAKVEAEKAKADTARAQVEIIQARSAAARAEGKLQEAQIQATKAQTLSMQQQAAAARQQAAAAQAQARAAQQQNSLNLMTQGLKMLSGNQSSSSRLRTNCSWSSIGISCR